MNKKEKKTEKKYFDIKVEVLTPTIITYRVLAANAIDALKEAEKISCPVSSVKHNLSKKIKLNAKIYDAGSTIMRHSKTYKAI